VGVTEMLRIIKTVSEYLGTLREGPRSQGASWAICGSGVPPYDFLNSYGVFNNRFCLKVPERLSLRLPLKAL
jgi:hypothetical protein